MGVENTPPVSPYNMDESEEVEGDESEVVVYEEDVDEVVADDVPGLMDDDNSDDDDIEPAQHDEIEDDAVIVFRKHEDSVFCCNVDPVSGSLVVTGGKDDKAYVWETKTGNVVLECKGHTDSVVCAEFNRDGMFVATGDMAGTIHVWKLATKEVVFETNIGDLSWLKWHHGTNVLLGGAMDGETYLWKIPSGDCKVYSGHGQKSSFGLFLPDGKRAAVGYDDGSVKVFDLKSSTLEHHIPGRDNISTLTCMDAHPDNNLLLASGADGMMSLIKTQTGKVVTVLDCNQPGSRTDDRSQSVEAVSFCRDNTLPLAATGSLDGSLIIWDTSKMARRHDIKQGSGITKLLWDRNTAILYTAGLDGKIRQYDARSGLLQRQWSGFHMEILDISLSCDGSTLVACSDDGTARVFTGT